MYEYVNVIFMWAPFSLLDLLFQQSQGWEFLFSITATVLVPLMFQKSL